MRVLPHASSLHRSRLAALAVNVLLATGFVLVAATAGTLDLWLAIVGLAVMGGCAVAVRAQGLLGELSTAGLIWVLASPPATTWWALLAGPVLFGMFVAGALAMDGPRSASIEPETLRRWFIRSGVVLACSCALAAFGLLLRSAGIHGSLLFASVILIVLAAGLIATQRLLLSPSSAPPPPSSAPSPPKSAR